jgi:hypothetical protein
LSGVGGEQTAADVHSTLCDLVTTEAAQHSAWAEYAAVLLDEETAAFFAARLTEGKGVSACDEPDPPSKKKKKRKLGADSEEADSAAATSAEPEITLRVACLDGSSLDLKVPPRELVREVKRAIGQVRRQLVTVSPFADVATTTSCFAGHSRHSCTLPSWCLPTTLPPARCFPTCCCLHRRATWTRA